ncbi:hypothetical protein SMD20_21645 [Nonomuraea sp. LP-02]|uniref:hypothetical protein n=1 Tax=Nonomuraea sp. LP-02 TaxID=3097960 RepID=UPI002E341B5E|nr:hypothetical protein [Nonomuraea sp. LP-02]MED7926875.1 hypothetical protein [Nonomuraea sp. LP-02]
MRKSYKMALPVVLAAGLLAAPGVLASSSASATTATASLTLTGGGCEPLARRFLCEVSFSGGVAPVAVRWYVNGSNVASLDGKTFVTIGCQPTFRYDIRAVISDATGASVEFSTSPTCRSGNP